MGFTNNKFFSLYRDADLEAFYDIGPKHRWNIVFAHMMLHFLPVLVITVFFWSVFEGELLTHAIVLSLIFYMLVVAETAAYLFPESRKIIKKYFPWLLVPLFILGGFAGYKVGTDVLGPESVFDGAVKDNPELVSIGIAGGFGIFVWTYIGMSLVLKASRILYTKRANIESDIRFATEVQERILQDVPLELNGTKGFARSLPANELGGDYFELSKYEHSIFATVGDISGHSFGAGLLMTMTKSAVQTHLQYTQDPARVMSALNTMLVRQSDRSMYATMMMLNLDLNSKKATICNAGHPPIFHFSRSKGEINKRTIKGLGLGILAKAEYSNHEFPVEEGDFLILYSDGLIEIRDDDAKIRDSEYFEQIIQKINLTSFDSPENVVHTLFEEVRMADHSENFEDDATLVVIKI